MAYITVNSSFRKRISEKQRFTVTEVIRSVSCNIEPEESCSPTQYTSVTIWVGFSGGTHAITVPFSWSAGLQPVETNKEASVLQNVTRIIFPLS